MPFIADDSESAHDREIRSAVDRKRCPGVDFCIEDIFESGIHVPLVKGTSFQKTIRLVGSLLGAANRELETIYVIIAYMMRLDI